MTPHPEVRLRPIASETAAVQIDLRPTDLGGDVVVLRPPATEVSRQERLAVGRVLSLISHGFDFVALATPLLVAETMLQQSVPGRLVVLFAAVGTVLLWSTTRRGRLVAPPSEGLLSIVARVGLAPIVTLLIVAVLLLDRVDPSARSIDVLSVAWIVVGTIPLILLGRLLSFHVTRLVRRRGYDLEDTLIVGTGPVGVELFEALQANTDFGLLPVGLVDRFDGGDLPVPILGRPEHLPELIALTGARHVVLAFGATTDPELVAIVRRCQDHRVQFYAVPRLFELGMPVDNLGHEVDGLPLVPVRRAGSSARLWAAKRAFDILASSVLLVLASPVMLCCALAVKLTSPGPAFFRQDRIGAGGRVFEMIKFRTMAINGDSETQWSVHDDQRVTRVGRVMRPTHLDELPQLFNVVRGEMSLVGPRPERPHFVEQFGEEVDGYDFRHRVPVGITGWAQVNGYWGDTSIATRVRLDNRYIENWSLWRDLVIGLRTIPKLLGKRR